MKNTVTMSSRRFGAYEAKSYFITLTRDNRGKSIKIRFVNDDNPVEACELTIETDVLVNIATAVQSDSCTNYQLNVRDGKIADLNNLSHDQRIALLETRLAIVLLGEKLPFDITDKRNGELLYAKDTKITKNSIREIALHFGTWTMPSSPIKNRISMIIKDVMG